MTKITPDEILRLARTNNTVLKYVKLWSEGMLTWDEAMMGIIVELTSNS